MDDVGTLGTHPVLTCLQATGRDVDDVVSFDPGFLDTDTKAEALVEIERSIERLTAMKLSLIAAAGDVAERDGTRDVAAWMARTVRESSPGARREQRLATALDRRWHHLATACLAGGVNQDQAQTIVTALDALPEDLDPALVEKAELHLVTLAADHGPAELTRLGRHILDNLAPEIAEEELRRRLEAEERDARITTRLNLRDRGDGTTDLKGRLPSAAAGHLKTMLDAFASPRQPDQQADLAARREQWEQAVQAGFAHPDGPGVSGVSGVPGGSDGSGGFGTTSPTTEPAGDVGRLPYSQRLGQALVALVERITGAILPTHGGTSTQLVVTIDEQALRTGLGTALTSTGHELSAGEARRLACNAGILPVVLDGKSRPLDLGRSQRFFNAAQRVAMAVRDKHCRADGCDIPAAWCEAHHLQPWSRGGPTDLGDGVLLCSFHHHRAHDPIYLMALLANGDYRFTRRT